MNERRESLRVPMRMVVDQILDDDIHCKCMTEDLSLEGMRLNKLPDPGPWGSQPRHAWLQFRLPDDEGTLIRALGELKHEGVDDEGAPVRGYRFKYIYPSARRRFEAFLGGSYCEA